MISSNNNRILSNTDVVSLLAEIPSGHHHIRTTLFLADGSSVTLQEATVAAIVRAYIKVKTHPEHTKVSMRGHAANWSKDGYATWQLIEE